MAKTKEEVIFVRFYFKERPERSTVHAGKNLVNILRDTEGGKGNGGQKYGRREFVTEEHLRKQGYGLLKDAKKTIQHDHQLSYVIANPEECKRRPEFLKR